MIFQVYSRLSRLAIRSNCSLHHLSRYNLDYPRNICDHLYTHFRIESVRVSEDPRLIRKELCNDIAAREQGYVSWLVGELRHLVPS